MVEQHRRDPALPGVQQLLDRIERSVIATRPDAVGRRVAWRAALTMAATLRDPAASPEVSALLSDRLQRWGEGFRAARGNDEDAAWQRHLGALLIDQDRLNAVLDRKQRKPEIPPGMPIESEWFGELPGL